MTLTIQFSPQEEMWIVAQAEQQGVPPADVIKQLVDARLPNLRNALPSRKSMPRMRRPSPCCSPG